MSGRKSIARWLKFNLVGAGGVLVQLGLLEAWMHFSIGNYLLGTVLAVEAALLHNFGWHSIFTWRDRTAPNRIAWVARALRFHLSNGAVSLLGNLVVMQLLVGLLACPVLAANFAAIVSCSILNFFLGDRWVFSDAQSVAASATIPPEMTKRLLLPRILVFLVCCVLVSIVAQAQNKNASQGSSSAYVTGTITQYSLPPAELAKAHALYTIGTSLYFVETAWGFLVLLLILRWRVGPAFRDLAERATRFRFVQAFIFVPLLILVLDVASLPFRLYGHHLSLSYGLSLQKWGSWFWDWTKGELISMLVASLLLWLLYWLIAKSPRRWWFYAWLGMVPVMVFFVAIAPIVFDPLFNKFEPLEKTDPALVQAIEKVTTKAGLTIPPDRMFLMKASEKVTTSNAYVTGLGATKRVVVWDTTLQQLTIPQTLFVFGHELGHYVLHHIPKGLAFAAIMLFFGFWIVYHAMHWFVARWGTTLHMRAVGDWASLPALILIASVLGFLAEPISNGFSRHIEHQADVYGLNITRGINSDYRQVAAQSFQSLGEHSLDYPYPSKLMVFWTYTHPDIASRVQFALHFQPGEQ